ncbi:hypothetical protein [Roseivivax marinus]|uniref:hypothetical protein n=1 Tax=Roseivivax marinus TaxID=1379903 RepID=UPI00273F6645|nr:hypothetical protein [Roseivivax marinus]
MEIDYQRGEGEGGEHFTVVNADIEVQQLMSAYLSMSTAVNFEDVRKGDIGCSMGRSIGGEPVIKRPSDFTTATATRPAARTAKSQRSCNSKRGMPISM